VAAERAVEQSNDEDTQDWQRGRVRGKLARAWLMLGNEAAAASYSTNLDPAEAKAVADQRVRQAALTNFEAQLQAVIGPLNSGNFEQIKAGLETAELLYAAVYAEADKRTQVDAAMRKGWEKMPLDLRIQALLGMATAAVDHADKGTARTLLDEARADIDRAKWLLEHRLPVEARWSTVLGKAGDTDGATQRLAQAMELYERERANTVNIYRAGALRPVAEAYAQLGQPAQALVLYQRALEEGMENPNSRPRLDDLAATVISMAVQGVQPSADTRTRIQSIAAQLGDPW
jgi:tetratricopeptide (TPR) repeat protein